MKRKVLNFSFYRRDIIAPALERLAAEAELVFCNEVQRSLTEEEVIGCLNRHPDAEVTIAADDKFTDRVFGGAPQLKMIARDGVGFDSIDLAAAARRGVIVNNAPVTPDSVADLTFGLIIATVRRILTGDRGMRAGRFTDRDAYLARDVNGMTLGILGFGRIGQAVAKRAAGFDMTVLACDPYASPASAEKLSAKLVGFDELLGKADILTIHAPLTSETRGMVNAQALSKMKDGAFLINAARGAIVDEPALLQALKSGKLAGAGLDVLCEDGPVRHPLYDLDTVVFTPHVGNDTLDTFLESFDSAVDDILLFLAGRWPRHVVNPDVRIHPRFAGFRPADAE
jgi:D-3-phosphoglycerate dehydrogenase